jgi:hypothetical protein
MGVRHRGHRDLLLLARQARSSHARLRGRKRDPRAGARTREPPFAITRAERQPVVGGPTTGRLPGHQLLAPFHGAQAKAVGDPDFRHRSMRQLTCGGEVPRPESLEQMNKEGQLTLVSQARACPLFPQRRLPQPRSSCQVWRAARPQPACWQASHPRRLPVELDSPGVDRRCS